MYLVMMLVLILCVLYSIYYKNDRFFVFEFILLTMFICFRYAQGTDYFGYELDYYGTVCDYLENGFSSLWNGKHHCEVGWKTMCVVCYKLGFSFEIFNVMVGLISMALTYVGIKRFSQIRSLSLLFLYPTVVLTYYMSSIRQGLVMAVFFGVGINLLCKKCYFRYIFVVILCMLIHKGSLILLIAVLLPLVKRRYYWGIIGAIVGTLLCIIALKMNIFSGMYISLSPNWMGITYRVLIFMIIGYIHFKQQIFTGFYEELYFLYFVGFCIYISVLPVSFVASRLFAFFMPIEVILISYLIDGEMKLFDSVVFTIIIITVVTMTVKNINSFIYQDGHAYSENVSFYNYPYVSLFNKSDIYKYRSESKYCSNIRRYKIRIRLLESEYLHGQALGDI